MSSKHRALRGAVLVEDRRTARFIRAWFKQVGVDPRRFRFEMPPKGPSGSGEAWVRELFPEEVKFYRERKNHQASLCLIAIRDGDRPGVVARRAELDEALRGAGIDPRLPGERIALPVPTWSIESWLLNLLGHDELNEDRGPNEDGPRWKDIFERAYNSSERDALRRAAERLCAGPTDASLPSLLDGHTELKRLTS